MQEKKPPDEPDLRAVRLVLELRWQFDYPKAVFLRPNSVLTAPLFTFGIQMGVQTVSSQYTL